MRHAVPRDTATRPAANLPAPYPWSWPGPAHAAAGFPPQDRTPASLEV